MPTTHLLYLHGFRSGPQSAKAQMTAAHVAQKYPHLTWWCPQLPPSPKEAMRLIERGTVRWPREGMAVIGSSLGGFYATWVAEQARCKAVMLNPAVYPARDLRKHIGMQTAYHDPQARFFFRAEYVDELLALRRGALAEPKNYFCVIAKGDEVLDWGEMCARYAGARIKLLEGGDHGLGDYAEHIGEVFDFLDPAPATDRDPAGD